MRSTAIIFMIFLFTQLQAQEHCVFRPTFVSTDLYPADESEFNQTQHFHITNDSILVDTFSSAISNKTVFPFDSKDDLLRTMACIYSFPSAPENTNGDIVKYQLTESIPNIGDQLTFINYDDCGDQHFYVLTQFGLYRFFNSVFWTDKSYELPYTTDLVLDTLHIVDFSEVDTTVELIVIQTPEIEVFTYQVLESEAFTELIVHEAQFSEEEIYIYQEQSDCPDAIFDTLAQEILIKDSYLAFDISPSIFETVSEQLLAREAFDGGVFFERELIGQQTIVTQGERVVLNGYTATSECNDLYYYPCLDVDTELIPRQDTVVGISILPCPSGYNTAGRYCYDNEGSSPALYTIRTYEKLVSDAILNGSTFIPAQYLTTATISISNKDELDPECISVSIDTLIRSTLINQTSIEEVNQPLVYGLYSYGVWSGNSEFEVSHDTEAETTTVIPIQYGDSYSTRTIESDYTTKWNKCTDLALKMAMVEKELISSVDVANQEFYQALIDYQIDNELQVGIINRYLIFSLEVKFGY